MRRAARCEAGRDILGTRIGAQRQDRNGAPAARQFHRANLAGGGQSIHNRHLDIHQDHVKFLGSGPVHRLAAMLDAG